MRLIDADKIMADIAISERNTSKGYSLSSIARYIRTQPTIDAELIIRCKDCKWFGIDGLEGFTLNGKPLRYAVCKHKNGMRGITVYSYCSRAERKEE